MIRKTGVFLIILICCLTASSCAGKLTTIRPTLISRIAVTDCLTDETVEHIRAEQEELDWLMDDLVFQMEQLYNKEGKCTESDEHLYECSFYMDEKLELSVFINSDGSVCKNNSRYVQINQNDSANAHPVDSTQWQDFFEFSVEE